MRVLIAAASLIVVAGPAFAYTPFLHAPAPLLAAGPAGAAIVGGALFVARLFKKK